MLLGLEIFEFSIYPPQARLIIFYLIFVEFYLKLINHKSSIINKIWDVKESNFLKPWFVSLQTTLGAGSNH